MKCGCTRVFSASSLLFVVLKNPRLAQIQGGTIVYLVSLFFGLEGNSANDTMYLVHGRSFCFNTFDGGQVGQQQTKRTERAFRFSSGRR